LQVLWRRGQTVASPFRSDGNSITE
jgi:hypothetical protein